MKSKSTTMPLMLSTQSSKPWIPHNYQKKAIKFLLEHAAAALFLDPGLGKTSITLAAIKLLIKKKILSKVLIIAPLRVCHTVWPAEQQHWTDFHGLRMVVLHGRYKDELLNEDADIYVINPEGLEWLLQAKKIKHKSVKTGRITTRVEVDIRRWKRLGFDTLVIDELSKFKNPNTNRYKGMKAVIHTFARRWGLTGSPAANGLMDLFGQCFMLDQGRTLGRYITHFRNEYFLPAHDGFNWILKEGADEQIYKRLHPLALRMAAEDYIKMPKLIPNNIYVELPERVRDIYDQLEDDLITKIDTKVVTAATSAVASMKCRQVANGAIYLNPEVKALVKLPSSKREWIELHDEKIEALVDLIGELQGAPLLVAYDFGHDLERLRKRFPKAIFTGDYNMAQFKVIESDWNNGKIDLMFAHPQSIGHGLNLQKAKNGCHVAWFAMTWSFDTYDQFIRRIRRQGQKATRVFVHHILAKDTVDELMLYALHGKEKGQNALFAALKRLSSFRKAA